MGRTEVLRDAIPWRRIFVEGVAVVLSILLAFSIDAWWDRRVERREAAEHISALRSDFLATIDELDRGAAVHNLRLGAAQALISVPKAETMALGYDSIQSLLGATVRTTTVDPYTAALNSLVGSGQLSLILDGTLRARLADWRRLIEDHADTQALLVREITEVYDPWLRSVVLLERRGHKAPFVSADFGPAFDGFLLTSELINVVDRTTVVLRELARIRTETEEILLLLDGALDGAEPRG